MVRPIINFVASFPKSGNTWVRLLLDHYMTQCEDPIYDVRFSDATELFFQMVSPLPVSKLALGAQIQLRGAALFTMATLLSRPTLVKTHHYAGEINGMRLFPSQWTGKAIYVVRDPRDVVASFQHHMGLESREEAIQLMREGRASIKSDDGPIHFLSTWSNHVDTWLELDPLLVRYEDLHADTEGELVRMLDYLEVGEIDGRRVTKAVKRSRFEKLKAREQDEDEPPFPEASSKSEAFFRKGQTGSFRDELDEEQVRAVESDHGEVMERLAYAPSRNLTVA